MASSNSHMSTGGNGAHRGNGNGDRPRLTDAEKKQNHIVSEQKRRAAIRQGYDRLAALVPGMEGLGRSEAAVLEATVTEMKAQIALKEKIKRKLQRDQPLMTDAQFEAFYSTLIPTQNQASAPMVPTVAPTSNASSPGASSSSGGGSKSKGKKKS